MVQVWETAKERSLGKQSVLEAGAEESDSPRGMGLPPPGAHSISEILVTFCFAL